MPDRVINQMDITDNLQNTKDYTFFSAPHGAFFKTDHIYGQKTILNKYKEIETTPRILSDHHRLTLDVNNSRNNRKPIN